jgi:alpha-amylase/alpha-mannosidase (GH57 family)
MKQSKNHGTFNQQPQPLYTPLLTYYLKLINYFEMTQNVNIAFRVGSPFKEASTPHA